MFLTRAVLTAAVALLGAVAPAAASGPDGASPIRYRTFFQDPGSGPTPDFSLENRAIALINDVPSGGQITFTFRDFNRNSIADALIAAQRRGVAVDGVIDGQERTRAVVQRLQAALGPDRFVICGNPTFEFHSCIANTVNPFVPRPPVTTGKSLQHNKYMTFSRADGRDFVVLQPSENWLSPQQYNYYNDMVEISGDEDLYRAYVQYLFDLKGQVRSENRYVVTNGDDGRNTMFPSPRLQSSLDEDDTIADRLREVDCSEGGSAAGTGLIRIGNMQFDASRRAILRELLKLNEAGCQIEHIFTNADGEVIAGLVSAGIPVYPFYQRAAATATGQRIIVHDKFWLVDAKSKLTGRRTKIAYVGSSNWRTDEQYSDDMLLRIVDDGVYDAYTNYWELIKSRRISDQDRPANDAVVPTSALTATPGPNTAGWNRSDVNVRLAASDGHAPPGNASGLERFHIESSGAQLSSEDILGEDDGYRVRELTVSAEGTTTISHFAEDRMGNRESPHSYVVSIDKTPPVITGLPDHCRLWPPNHKFREVADVSATDPVADVGLNVSGIAELVVTASSNDPAADDGDIRITYRPVAPAPTAWPVDALSSPGRAATVALRAAKARAGSARVYEIQARATDRAGNSTTASATCIVPHSNGGGDR
jgi:hypothetical protein